MRALLALLALGGASACNQARVLTDAWPPVELDLASALDLNSVSAAVGGPVRNWTVLTGFALPGWDVISASASSDRSAAYSAAASDGAARFAVLTPGSSASLSPGTYAMAIQMTASRGSDSPPEFASTHHDLVWDVCHADALGISPVPPCAIDEWIEPWAEFGNDTAASVTFNVATIAGLARVTDILVVTSATPEWIAVDVADGAHVHETAGGCVGAPPQTPRLRRAFFN